MSYDERLAERVRGIMGGRRGLEERKMFGGLAFLLNGKMFSGILERDLVARVGPDQYEAALGKSHVRPMDFTGHPMRGYVYVSPGGTATKRTLASWLARAEQFVSTLKGKPRS